MVDSSEKAVNVHEKNPVIVDPSVDVMVMVNVDVVADVDVHVDVRRLLILLPRVTKRAPLPSCYPGLYPMDMVVLSSPLGTGRSV